jgi:hypothetical protein
MKKYILQTGFLILFLACLLASCKNTANDKTNDNKEQSEGAKTVDVTFFNESSYNLIIHRDSFDGPVLLELPANSKEKTIPVRVSDNNGVGSMFSIEYIRIIQIFEEDNTIREVPVSGTDPSLQILMVLDAGKPRTIQIPNPKNLEIRSAYITILNTHNLPCEFQYFGTVFRQTDNNNIPIAPGKTGIYKNRYALPVEGELYQSYRVGTSSESVLVPEFIMKNGFIYYFRYDGTKVEKIREESIFIN